MSVEVSTGSATSCSGAAQCAEKSRTLPPATIWVMMSVPAVAQDADVVHRRVEDADLGALGVELTQADVLAPSEEGVGPGHGHGVRRNGDRILAHRAEIEHQPEAGQARRVARGLQGPELEELVAGEIEPGGAESRHHRTPARGVVPPWLAPPGGIVALDHAAGGVRVQRQVEDVLG